MRRAWGASRGLLNRLVASAGGRGTSGWWWVGWMGRDCRLLDAACIRPRRRATSACFSGLHPAARGRPRSIPAAGQCGACAVSSCGSRVPTARRCLRGVCARERRDVCDHVRCCACPLHVLRCCSLSALVYGSRRTVQVATGSSLCWADIAAQRTARCSTISGGSIACVTCPLVGAGRAHCA
jgi:hypothetical protein